MFTVCPKCALTLVVTAADLRVAQGHVRCGRCSSVFNALARLTEERQIGSPDLVSPPPPSPPTAPLPTSEPLPVETGSGAAPEQPDGSSGASPADPSNAAQMDAIPEEALEFDPTTTDAASVFVQAKPDPEWEAATGSFKAMVAANQEPVLAEEPDGLVEVEIDSAFLSDMIQADVRGATPAPAPTPAPGSAAPAEPVPADESASAASHPASARVSDLRHTASHARPTLGADAQPRAVTSRMGPPPEHELGAGVDAEQDAAQLTDRRPYLWMLGIAAAVVALCAQIVNHYRDELAASARFNHPLTALYRTFGVTLKPHWDVHAYDIRQLGASVEPENAGQITVRASIKNAGEQAQPLPLLRVTLQDRFGNRIAARDVQPQFYVPGAVPAAALLGAGQRIDAEMTFLDPGANAVGFELDACLPASGGGVACANDASAR
jgi:predicted Zn finger-like uncharacterized protein